MAQTSATVGGWSGENRTAAERVADYDWDGAIRPAAEEIAALIAGREAEIAGAFWDHYLALPVAAHIRPFFDAATLASRVAKSAHYTRAKYAAAYDDDWMRMATHHAAGSQKAGIPLQALLSSLSFAHSRTMMVIEQGLGGDVARTRVLADTIQRLGLVEADVMASYLGARDAERAQDERRAHPPSSANRSRRRSRAPPRSATTSACRRAAPRNRRGG